MVRRTIGVLCLSLAWMVPGVATAQTEQVYYYHTDAVGSVRMITDANGQEVTRYDFWPFGQVSGAPAVQDSRMFTGQEHDAESQSDYLGARYYQGQMGRFTTPDDPVYMDLFNPQSLNRYAYAYNNPLRWVDPTGHDGECPPEAKSDICVDVVGKNPPDIGLRLFLITSLTNPFGNYGPLSSSRITMPNWAGPCQLQQPSGNYTLETKNVIPLFQPDMKNALDAAFRDLNKAGIIPMITSGFRTAADQNRMRAGASGPNPAAIISPHQVGRAVDINSQTPSFSTIRNALTGQGLTWGGTFKTKDPVHFQLAPAVPGPAELSACGR